MLAKPQTFMNLSGTSLAPLMEKHSIDPDRLVVVYDELDLPWLALRIKPKGSAAGHNGMNSVIGSLGTSELVRVRLGIHPGHPAAGVARNLCWRRCGARRARNWTNSSATRPMRFVP